MLTERTYDSALFKVLLNIITNCVFIELKLIDLNNGVYYDLRNKSACVNTVLGLVDF